MSDDGLESSGEAQELADTSIHSTAVSVCIVIKGAQVLQSSTVTELELILHQRE